MGEAGSFAHPLTFAGGKIEMAIWYRQDGHQVVSRCPSEKTILLASLFHIQISGKAAVSVSWDESYVRAARPDPAPPAS